MGKPGEACSYDAGADRCRRFPHWPSVTPWENQATSTSSARCYASCSRLHMLRPLLAWSSSFLPVETADIPTTCRLDNRERGVHAGACPSTGDGESAAVRPVYTEENTKGTFYV